MQFVKTVKDCSIVSSKSPVVKVAKKIQSDTVQTVNKLKERRKQRRPCDSSSHVGVDGGVHCCVIDIKKLLLAVVIPLSIWLGLSSFAYNRIYLAGKERSYCWKDGLYSSDIKFTQMADCVQCITNTNVSMRYLVPEERIEEVRFMPREDDYWIQNKIPELHAWLFNYDNFTSAPTVIVVHGIRSCRKGCSAALASAMLFHNGYNVLALDLRNHGSSPHLDPPYATFGHKEFRDVLGAFDFLHERYGEKVSSNVGLMGLSMGGAVSLIAYEREMRFKALFLDSPACDVYGTLKFGIENTLKSFGHGILKGCCLLRGGSYGCAPFENDPLDSASRIIDRPVHFDHCSTDAVVPEFSTRNCFAAMKKANPSHTHLSKYIAPSPISSPACSDHLVLMLTDSETYEKRLVSFFDKYLRG